MTDLRATNGAPGLNVAVMASCIKGPELLGVSCLPVPPPLPAGCGRVECTPAPEFSWAMAELRLAMAEARLPEFAGELTLEDPKFTVWPPPPSPPPAWKDARRAAAAAVADPAATTGAPPAPLPETIAAPTAPDPAAVAPPTPLGCITP